MVRTLSDEQIRILRFCFKLRIEQMKEGKLGVDYYVISGQFYEDLEECGISGMVDRKVFQFIDRIFKEELVKSAFNPNFEKLC